VKVPEEPRSVPRLGTTASGLARVFRPRGCSGQKRPWRLGHRAEADNEEDHRAEAGDVWPEAVTPAAALSPVTDVDAIS